ncbi:MAG TPA: hypothetical protein VKV04_11205 [Verrucomicrobiae bacterium]|nr:hypothetical protein [Verrucomicrobiae bacterium]
MELLPVQRQIALKSWLKRYNGNRWMQDQDGWKERASLIASCNLPSNIFNWRRILYCARHGLFCGSSNQCVRCCLDKRIQPALDEHGGCFKSARFWYPMVINTRVLADEAGVELVGEEFADEGFGNFKSRPYKGNPDGHPLLTSPEYESYFERLCRAFFALPTLLKDNGVISGAFSHLEFHLSFCRNPSNYYYWSDLGHHLQPHLNVLFNSSVWITPPLAEAIYEALGELLVRHDTQLGYPNLWIGPAIENQDSLNRWLAYMLKPWPIDVWYRRAFRRGCNRNHLNLLFDEIVFVNLNHLVRRVVSPRKIGNMNCQSLRFGNPYIGNQPPKALSMKQVSQWLKVPAFAALHPDWEESVYQLLEKRRKRKGNRAPGADDTEP